MKFRVYISEWGLLVYKHQLIYVPKNIHRDFACACKTSVTRAPLKQTPAYKCKLYQRAAGLDRCPPPQPHFLSSSSPLGAGGKEQMLGWTAWRWLPSQTTPQLHKAGTPGPKGEATEGTYSQVLGIQQRACLGFEMPTAPVLKPGMWSRERGYHKVVTASFQHVPVRCSAQKLHPQQLTPSSQQKHHELCVTTAPFHR